MIRFKCIYCGQRILARDGRHGKKGKCPNCQHMLVVPRTTKGRPAISSDKEPMPDRPKPPQIHIPMWEKGVIFGRDPQEDEAIELCKESFGFLIPTYDKLSLFLMVVTLLLLSVINAELRDRMRDLILWFLIARNDILLIILLSAFWFGAYLYCALASDAEPDLKKIFMLAFAVLANIASGFFAGTHVIVNTAEFSWLLVFPIWNIFNSFLLVLMLQYKFIDEECISDRKATFFQIIFGLLSVAVILVLCNYVFKLYWAMTFSICIVYTTSFDRALQNVLPGLTDRADEG